MNMWNLTKIKKKPIHLISIALIALLLLFSGCLDNNLIDETGPDAKINLPKDSFSKYEDIHFEIKNTGDTVLEFGRAFNIEYYDENTDEWTQKDLDLVWPQDLIILEPGETFDQQVFNPSSNFITEAKDGEYRIIKNLHCADTGESFKVVENFHIDMDEPYPNASLSLDKDNFDKNENIEYTVKNIGTTPITFGRMFEVKFYEQMENRWKPVEMQMAVTLEMIVLDPGESFKQSFNPSEHFAKNVEDGLYRINKSVTCTETEDVLYLETEFNIVGK